MLATPRSYTCIRQHLLNVREVTKALLILQLQSQQSKTLGLHISSNIRKVEEIWRENDRICLVSRKLTGDSSFDLGRLLRILQLGRASPNSQSCLALRSSRNVSSGTYCHHSTVGRRPCRRTTSVLSFFNSAFSSSVPPKLYSAIKPDKRVDGLRLLISCLNSN